MPDSVCFALVSDTVAWETSSLVYHHCPEKLLWALALSFIVLTRLYHQCPTLYHLTWSRILTWHMPWKICHHIPQRLWKETIHTLKIDIWLVLIQILLLTIKTPQSTHLQIPTALKQFLLLFSNISAQRQAYSFFDFNLKDHHFRSFL